MGENILFIGPTRCGTTFVWSVLLHNSRRNEKISLYYNKEHYLFEQYYGTTKFNEEYARIFNDNKINIDLSPTVFHLLKYREKILKDKLFDKIVVIVRDPLELWTSSYKYSVSDGMSKRGTFEKVVSSELCGGYSYKWILKTLIKYPDLRKKISILHFDQIIDRRKLKDFLGELCKSEIEFPKSGKVQQNSSSKLIPQNYVLNKLRDWIPIKYRRNYFFKMIRRFILKFVLNNQETLCKSLGQSLQHLINVERKIISELVKITG
jgi:hypothetical protein